MVDGMNEQMCAGEDVERRGGTPVAAMLMGIERGGIGPNSGSCRRPREYRRNFFGAVRLPRRSTIVPAALQTIAFPFKRRVWAIFRAWVRCSSPSRSVSTSRTGRMRVAS